MEESKKKIVMLITIPVCLLLAVIIFFSTRSPGSKIPDFKGETIALKCVRPECQATHKMGKHEYYTYIQKNRHPMSLSAPPMTCEKCGEVTAYKGILCETCDVVFFPFAAQGEFPDLCPKCGSRDTIK